MIDIEQRAVATYQNNLVYFAAHHPALARKLQVLQQAIESGHYPEHYALEYVGDYFDVKSLADGSFLYGSSSAAHAETAADSVSFKKNESAIETLYNFPYTRANVDDLDKLSIINSHLVGTAPVVRFVNEQTAGRDTMKKIYKFIFFGVGLGVHLGTIHEKISADSYLVIEENLELFRLSLFVTDYAAMGAKSRLFFSVMDAPGDFKITYNLFAEDLLIRNSHLKFYLLSDAYAPKIKQIQNFAVTQSYLMYPYSYLLHKNLRISRAIEKGYRFLNILKPFDPAPFAQKPVLYLAAGPSLSRNIAWVRTHRDRFVVVAVFMICPRLEAAGIVPDIVIHVDENSPPVRKTVDRLRDKTSLASSLFILAASAPLELFETIVPREQVFLLEDRTRYKKDHGHIEFFSVGEVGYALSLILGARELYLLGLDLAVDQATGKTHTEGHATEDAIDMERSGNGPETSGSLRGTVLQTKGNRGASVATTPLFDASVHKVNDYTRTYKKEDQTVFNLGDGAFFEGTLPAIAETVDTGTYPVIDRPLLRAELRTVLGEHASDRLSDTEKSNLIVREKEVKKKAKLIERFARQPVKGLDDFRTRFVKLIGELITPVRPDLIENSDIFRNYFHNIGGYIGNLLNTEDLDAGNQTAQALQNVLSRQLYKLLHAFGRMAFGYLNDEKYFDPGSYRVLQDEILIFRTIADGKSHIEEIYLDAKMRSGGHDAERLKGAFKKDHIGCFVDDDLSGDAAFIQYLRRLGETFPATRFVLFYVTEMPPQTLVNALEPLKERVTVMQPDTIYDVVENIEVLIHTPAIPATVNKSVRETCAAIHLVRYAPETLNVSVAGYPLTLPEVTAKIFADPVRLGFTEKEAGRSEGNFLKLYIETYFHRIGESGFALLDDDSCFDVMAVRSIGYALTDPGFKTYFFELRNRIQEMQKPSGEHKE